MSVCVCERCVCVCVCACACACVGSVNQLTELLFLESLKRQRVEHPETHTKQYYIALHIMPTIYTVPLVSCRPSTKRQRPQPVCTLPGPVCSSLSTADQRDGRCASPAVYCIDTHTHTTTHDTLLWCKVHLTVCITYTYTCTIDKTKQTRNMCVSVYTIVNSAHLEVKYLRITRT